MPQYWLSKHVHACVTPAGAILLDLRADRYLGVATQDSQALSVHVHGWPSCSDQSQPGIQSSPFPEELVANLLRNGVLVREAPLPAVRPMNPDMTREFISVGDELEVRASIRTRDVINFTRAYAAAAGSLRFRAFHSVIKSVQSRKRPGERTGALLTSEPAHVAALIDRFRRLRACALTAEGSCLLHAVTLVKFLHCYGFHPDFVIGVVAQPFAAHAWVQWHQYLLDTNPEKVCLYTPILVA